MLPGNRANSELSHPDLTSSGAEVHGIGHQGSPRGALVASSALPSAGATGARQALRLWSPVVLRVLFGALLLGLVVYLGHRSQDVALYGESVTLLVEDRPRAPDLLVPSQIEPAPAGKAEPPPCPREPAKDAGSAGMTSDGKVILNEAGATELSTLPGVGAARADAILALRTRLGKFKKTTDLLRVRGIGFRTFAKWKDRIVVDRPEAEAPAGASLGDEDASRGLEDSTVHPSSDGQHPFPEPPPNISPQPRDPGRPDPSSPTQPLPDSGTERRSEIASRAVATLGK